MRLTQLVVFILCLVSIRAAGQNLVPNGSFENHNSCPSSLVSIPYSPAYNSFPSLLNWTNPVKLCSPDYLHTCATATSGLRVPNSSFGYQQPHTGSAYGGIIAWEGQLVGGSMVFDYREYLQVRLSQPLQAGHSYCVSFYVSPTISQNFNFVALDLVGINVSASRPLDSTDYTLSAVYHIKNNSGNYLTDTSTWYRIAGTYLATGGEEWLTIGCFKNSTATPSFQLVYPAVPDPALDYRAYLFLDDISVRELSGADTVFAAHDTIVCKASGNNLPLAGVPGAVSYTWNTGSQAASIVAGDTGKYWCQSALECGMVIDSFHIRYRQPVVLDLGKDTVNCFSQPVALSANHAYDSYLWSTGDTLGSITVTQTGIYTVTVADICGLQQDTVEVTIQAPTPPPVVHDTLICQFTPNPKINVSGTGIRWYPVYNLQNGLTAQPVIPTMFCGSQVVYVTQTLGKCESTREPVTIRIKYKPDADIGNYYSICKGVDSIIGREYPEVNYLWNTNEMICCIQPRETGTYRLTISNECGISSDTAFVEISPCDDCMLIPTAFTPNNDGRNDVFRPILKCPVTDYKMCIYNRWGELVFSSTNPQLGWDGKEKESSEMGVYVYLAEYRSLNTGVHKRLRGNLTLIK